VGDPTRTKRALINLIGNAIKYTEHGSITFTCMLERIDEQQCQLTANIVDTGIGIAEDKIESIFKKFIQADNSITRKYGGSGLGLTITSELLQLMRGTISVKSSLGKGSAFTVKIPYALGKQEDIISLTKNEPTSSQIGTLKPDKVRILAAEDHFLNQALLKKLLPAMGLINFTITDDGRAVLDAYKTGNYDLILMDCHLPYISGYDATIAIRENEKTTGAHIPIIAMTANAMIGEETRCLKTGMDAYITKPLDRNALRIILNKWIDLSNTHHKSTKISQLSNYSTILDLSVITPYTNGNFEEEQEFATALEQIEKIALLRLREMLR
jgi:CheY-like chemotaxis protein